MFRCIALVLIKNSQGFGVTSVVETTTTTTTTECLLCRDDAIQGLRFFPNRFLEWGYPGGAGPS